MPDDRSKPSDSEGFEFLDEPEASEPSRSKPSRNPEPNLLNVRGDSPSDSDVFDLVGGEGESSSREAEPPPPPRAKPAPRQAKKVEEPRPVARVDEVWSRGKEWSSTVVLLGAVAVATLVLTYFALAAGHWVFGFFLLCFGAAVLVVLSYPIVITLERPVRMTPEHAVRDFYGALSHHRPHFRRMWLLLSTNGRSSTRFGSYEGFVACWKSWMEELRGPEESAWTPLHFDILNVKSEKSAGQSVVKISYKIRVFLRGHRDGEPLASYFMRQWIVRGPDGMWYLDDGAPPTENNGSESDSSGVDT